MYVIRLRVLRWEKCLAKRAYQSHSQRSREGGDVRTETLGERVAARGKEDATLLALKMGRWCMSQ